MISNINDIYRVKPTKENFEANEFADQLLMPELTFKLAISNGLNTYQKLSDEFEVPELAIKRRVKVLGLEYYINE